MAFKRFSANFARRQLTVELRQLQNLGFSPPFDFSPSAALLLNLCHDGSWRVRRLDVDAELISRAQYPALLQFSLHQQVPQEPRSAC